jgi:NAD(P)H-flavin reductase
MCAVSMPAQGKSLFLPEVATLVKTIAMTDLDRYFEFRLDGKDLGHKPGQFAEISIPGFGEAPFSISSSPTKQGSFEMVIRKVGKVTDMLHRLGPGDTVGIRGPFGTHFPMDEVKGKDLLFVGGGIGLVPMRSAINYALDHRQDYGRITILFGCKDPGQRLFVDEIKTWESRPDITLLESVDRCTDGTWAKHVGVITTLFSKLKDINPHTTKAFIVGPPVMYKFVILELKSLAFADADIIVSLERRMKCGVGKCGHCQINGVYVCQEGPVFTYESIKSLTEAL